jgi:hypothetical protein
MGWIYTHMLCGVVFGSVSQAPTVVLRHVLIASLGYVWQITHLPFIISFMLGATALSELFLATYCANARIEYLTTISIPNSEPDILTGLRWFYCVGLGIALASMGKLFFPLKFTCFETI